MTCKKSFVLVGCMGWWGFGGLALQAHSFGPPPRVTGAPGDNPAACTACHTGTPLNAGGGKVEIVLPGDAAYAPGVQQHIMVRITDPVQKRWGFEFSARLNSDLANGQAGELFSSDGLTQVFCESGGPKPCASGVEFISHNTAGTRAGTASPVTFEFDWTPPSSDKGPVTFYVAANAANGNNSNSGDHIYTSSVQLAVAAASSAKPVIQDKGVVNAASSQLSAIAPGSWVTIFGSNLAATKRLWGSDDIKNGMLPTSLDGVQVTINNKPAFVEFISPGQVNVLAPDDTSAGPVQIQIMNGASASDPVTVNMAALSPAFFTFDGTFAAATHADGTPIGKPGLFASSPDLTTPAKPGETVIFYGTGFGATDPSMPAAQLVTAVANATSDLKFSIGGMPAKISFAGLIPNFAGLFQFNVEVPAAAPDGDLPVSVQVGGVAGPSVSITVAK